MSWLDGFALLGGLGLFLFGMKVMGEGLEKAAGARLKRLLEIVTGNRLLAILAGVAITAVIQSSSATTVMVVGFVNAGLLSLGQATGVIMGANVGTTVTSLMLSVKLNFGVIFAAAGMILMFLTKKEGPRQAGQILMGLGVLFVGMDTMTQAMEPLKHWEGFRMLMAGVSNPLLGVLIGAATTAILQSSSASVGILQALAAQGLVSLDGAIFILFGQNIGTCVTALLASTGANHTARRAAVVHLLFNMAGTVVFVALAIALPAAEWIFALAPDNLRLQVALTHVLFNLGTTLLLLPGARLLEKAACLLVPGEDRVPEPKTLRYFDRRLLSTPTIAADQILKEAQRMGEIAGQSFRQAMGCFAGWDEEAALQVNRNEEVIDYLNQEITTCLVEVKGLDLGEQDGRMIGSLFHVVNDFERIGDHATNILECAALRSRQKVKFTQKAEQELEDLGRRVEQMLDQSMYIFARQMDDPDVLRRVEAAEEAVDAMTQALRSHHVERLKNKKCSAKNGMLYLDMLMNLERIADHANNIAGSVDKVTPMGAWQ